MSARENIFFIAGVGSGIIAGVSLAWGEAARRAEKKANERVIEEVAQHKRVIEMAAESYLNRKNAETDGPFETEEELDEPDTLDDAIKVGGQMTVETQIAPDYLQHARDYSDMPLASPVRELEYITEDEYTEEDGRDKEQILIHMGETEPLFVSAGVVVPNWHELISPNILVDMYQRCPPGTDKVLYVRNNRNDTDYEVIQEIP